MENKENKEPKVDLSSPISYLESVYNDRLVSLGDVPTGEREAVYDAIISPFLKACNILKAIQDGE